MFCFQHQDGRIHVWWHRGELTLAASISHRHFGPSLGIMVCGAIGYIFRLPLVRIDGILNKAFLVCYDPWLYPLFESCETIRLSRTMHNRMLLVLYGPSLIREVFDSCPGLHVHQIFHHQKTSGPRLFSDWIITIRQSLQLMR
ncbi:hypothetical protein TNCV_1694271 [Trichonephila clavipes]|nr:hypothetical protein TNCV_1694271 [Trichonephila clavipes]